MQLCGGQRCSLGSRRLARWLAGRIWRPRLTVAVVLLRWPTRRAGCVGWGLLKTWRWTISQCRCISTFCLTICVFVFAEQQSSVVAAFPGLLDRGGRRPLSFSSFLLPFLSGHLSLLTCLGLFYHGGVGVTESCGSRGQKRFTGRLERDREGVHSQRWHSGNRRAALGLGAAATSFTLTFPVFQQGNLLLLWGVLR